MASLETGSKKKSVWIAAALTAYIYLPYFSNILENALAGSPLLVYMAEAFLICLAIGISGKIDKRVLAFLLVFIALLLLNVLLVPYQYYVIIEGIQALLGVSVPCFCIANEAFDLTVFAEIWWKFSRWNFPLVLLAVIMSRSKLVHYSIFTSICAANVFIGAYMLLCGEKKRRVLLLNIFFNIVIDVVFGGRMSAMVSIGVFLFAYLFSVQMRYWEKVIIAGGVIAAVLLVRQNFQRIILWLINFLADHGMRSRSMNLLIQQLHGKKLYLTNRDQIYEVCVHYIRDRFGMPGGFGVPLYLTEGKYYYAHNIILQFLILFGFFGSILLLAVMLIRGRKLRRIAPLEYRRFTYFLLLCYIPIGMTGSSIWIHYLSTIFIALFFFGRTEIQTDRGDEKG